MSANHTAEPVHAFDFTVNAIVCSTHIYLFNFIYLFIYFWLWWVFVAVQGLSLVAASGGYSSLRYAGFSLLWLLVAEHGL